MALFIPTRCPKYFESVTLIQPQHPGGILGKTFVDDLLDQTFVDFCIGK